MNNLSGEGLFDKRPMTQTSLGRFVLGQTDHIAPFVCDQLKSEDQDQVHANEGGTLNTCVLNSARVAKLADARDLKSVHRV